MTQCLNWIWEVRAGGKTSVSSKLAFPFSHNSRCGQNMMIMMTQVSPRTEKYFTALKELPAGASVRFHMAAHIVPQSMTTITHTRPDSSHR